MSMGPQNSVRASVPLDQLKLKWKKLVALEEEAFARCVSLDQANPDRNPEKAEATREWWRILNAMIWMFVRTRMQYEHELEPFPAFAFGRVANIAEEIGAGNLPSFVTDARKGGRTLWRKERHHLAYAVLYIEAANRGDILDPAPNKTVRQLFRVTARAVQGWMKRRDELCVGVPYAHLTAEQLSEKMRDAAAVYSRIGRGAPSEN